MYETKLLDDAKLDAAQRELLEITWQMLDAIHQRGLHSHVSVKLTQLGLDISGDLCRENLTAIVSRAAGQGNFVRVDMEAASDQRAQGDGVNLLVLDDALHRLAAIDARKSEMLEMRYFGGLTQDELSSVLGVSLACSTGYSQTSSTSPVSRFRT